MDIQGHKRERAELRAWLRLAALSLLLTPLLLGSAKLEIPPGFLPDAPARAAAPAGPQQYGRFLVLKPAEYSRYEISPDGHVVVFFPLGVEGWYRGYHLRAGELRFDQLTETASLSGGVVFDVDTYRLACASISLDGRSGRGSIPGMLSGHDTLRDLYFQAAGAELSFAGGEGALEQGVKLSEVGLTLRGPLRAADAAGNVLLASDLHLEGSDRSITSTRPFDLLLAGKPGLKHSEVEQTAKRAQRPRSGPASTLQSFSMDKDELFPLLLHGEGLSGHVDEAHGITDLSVTSPLLRGRAVLVRGDLAQVNVPLLSSGARPQAGQKAALLSGSPLEAVLLQGPEQQVRLRAGQISVDSLAGDRQSWTLEGGAEVLTSSGSFRATCLNFERQGESYSVDCPDGISLDFSLAELSGQQELDFELPSLLGR